MKNRLFLVKNDTLRTLEFTNVEPVDPKNLIDSIKCKHDRYFVTYYFPEVEKTSYERNDIVYRIEVTESFAHAHMMVYGVINKNPKVYTWVNPDILKYAASLQSQKA